MKFEETQNQDKTIAPSENLQSEGCCYMDTDSENNADAFQAELYHSGVNLLEKLNELGCVGSNAEQTYERLLKDLERLKNFQFNIGFAGGMSSGKSTVINSLIEYPLMPTCRLTTTCVGTHMFYGEHPRISVIDDDTGKQVLNVDCRNISKEHFQKLKEYACVTTKVKLIENLQHFTSHNLFEDKDALQPDMLEMHREDPNHVIILMMILLTVYVDQNNAEKSEKALAANKKRKEVLDFFNFDIDTVNYTIQLQWDGDFLKSGMTITDLPGLGAYAPDKDMGEGKVMKGHDSISTDAIKSTDAMVFLVDPQVDGTGVPALQAMISSAELKEAVTREDLVIPVLNKVDDCNGKSEVAQAVAKFVDILKNTGLDKKNEDIHLYSAWYGEYAFSDIPDDRTCFFFRNFEDLQESILEDEDEDISENELYRKVMEKSHKKLKMRYQKSGIQELKDFFRAAYINKSKNRRSQAAVLAMRALALEIITPMEALLENYEVLHNVAGDVVKDISQNLKAKVDVPIAKALEEIMQLDHKDYYVKEKLEDIPAAYSMAFRDALDEYKTRNINIVNAFDMAFLGMSDNARIDQSGSMNYRNYQTLCEEMERIGVDVKGVNKKFSSILTHVTNETERMYNNSIRVLRNLKSDIPVALDGYITNYQESISGDDSVLQTIKALRNTIVLYMEQQIDTIESSMRINEDTMHKAGEETVNKILDLNTEMVRLYTNSVINEVRSARSNGSWFTSREYIKITGSGGLLETFRNLSLSAKDRAYIEGEVQSIGIDAISNNLDSWYQDAENDINKNFTRLRKKMGSMMDDTIREISDNTMDIEKKQELLREQLQEVKVCFADIRTKVQKKYADSIEGLNDDTLCKYRDNIFAGIQIPKGEEVEA